jgi:hypothetical protein
MHFNYNLIRIFFLFSILINWNYSIAQQDTKNTELLIVGTAHFGNPNITKDTIYNVLTKFQPDIILWEVNADFKPHWCLFNIGYKLNILKLPIEMLALHKFRKRFKSVPIIGFDSIKNRLEFSNYNNKVTEKYIEILDKTTMENKDSVQYTYNKLLRNEYIQNLWTNSLEEINSETIYNKFGKLQRMEYQILELAEKYITDKKIVNDYKELLDFSCLRNNNMVHKIKEVIKKNKGNRIVVITGLNHKYFLVDQLQKIDGLGIQWSSLLN